MRLTIDVFSVLLDGSPNWFVSHLVARTSWWRGRIVAAMNAQWIGRWDVAPRSHPDDGLLDVFDADLSLDDRLKARRRLLTGTHVPHPGIAQRRVARLDLDLGRPTPVHLDGERVGRARSLTIELEAGALTCVV
jgi:diacylglycerol kinase family enzyme